LLPYCPPFLSPHPTAMELDQDERATSSSAAAAPPASSSAGSEHQPREVMPLPARSFTEIAADDDEDDKDLGDVSVRRGEGDDAEGGNDEEQEEGGKDEVCHFRVGAELCSARRLTLDGAPLGRGRGGRRRRGGGGQAAQEEGTSRVVEGGWESANCRLSLHSSVGGYGMGTNSSISRLMSTRTRMKRRRRVRMGSSRWVGLSLSLLA
jgi:hypothetical protein